MHLLTIAVLVFSGVTAGVLFCVALSVVPAFLDLPADRYVQMHKAVGRRFDHVMPPMVIASALFDIALAVHAAGAAERSLFAAGGLLLLGVSLVSQFGNVPINRRVKGLPDGALPAGWRDPRRRWRGWHLLRTAFAIAALTLNASAVVLAG